MRRKQGTASRRSEITNIWKLIEAVADMERRVGEIYAHFATMFSSRRGVATFWREVAADEQLHALLVGSAREVFPVAAPAPPGDWSAKLKEIDELVKSVETELRTGLSLTEALERAEALERSELNVMTAVVLNRAEAVFSRFGLLGNLWRLDAHIEKFTRARARFCSHGRDKADARRGSCQRGRSPRRRGS